MPSWMKHNLESRLPGETRYADDTILTAEIEEELQSFLMKVKEGSEKAGLKLNEHGIQSHHFKANVSHSAVFDSFVIPWTVAYQAMSIRFSRQILEWVPISFSRGSS